MKQELPKPLIYAAIALAILIGGLFIYRAMSSPIGDQPTAADEQALYNAAVEQEKIVNGGPRGGGGEAAARGGK